MRKQDQMNEMPTAADPFGAPVQHRRRRWDRLPWTGAVILFAASLALLFGNSAIATGFATSVPFEVQASDVAGNMRIRWNAHAGDITHAEAAMLDVVDGDQTYRYPVSSAVLANGALDYIRKSDDVMASLVLYKNGQETGRRIVRSIGALTHTNFQR